ncbi:hypothetical protein OB13_20345 [Pontibacter sp. HJ8]
MKDLITQGVQALTSNPPSTLFSCRHTDSGTFDIAPLVEALLEDDSPAAMAKSLNDSYNLLAEYLTLDENRSGLHYANMLYNMRVVRDAILKGAGIIDFEQ